MRGEDQNIEYKQSWRDEYLKWICGFANASGGRMLIGVSGDRNRRILPKGVKAWSVRRGFAGTDPVRGVFYG